MPPKYKGKAREVKAREVNESDRNPGQSSQLQPRRILTGSGNTDTRNMPPPMRAFAEAGRRVGEEMLSARNKQESPHKESSTAGVQETNLPDDSGSEPPKKKRRVTFAAGTKTDNQSSEAGPSNPQSHKEFTFAITNQEEVNQEKIARQLADSRTSDRHLHLLDQLIEQGKLHSFDSRPDPEQSSQPSDHHKQYSVSEASPQKRFEELFHVLSPNIASLRNRIVTRQKGKSPETVSFLQEIATHLDNVRVGGYIDSHEGDARITSAQKLLDICSKYKENPAYTPGDNKLKRFMTDEFVPQLRAALREV